MQAERNETCFKLPRRSLSYTKIMQAKRNETCFKLPRRSIILYKDNASQTQ